MLHLLFVYSRVASPAIHILYCMMALPVAQWSTQAEPEANSNTHDIHAMLIVQSTMNFLVTLGRRSPLDPARAATATTRQGRRC